MCCDTQRNLCSQSRTDSMNDLLLQAHNQPCSPFCRFLSNSLRYQHPPSISLPSSNFGQSVFTHKLRPLVKPVCVIFITLPLNHKCHLPVVVRQLQASFGSVWFSVRVCRHLMERTVKLIVDGSRETEFKALMLETC